MTDEDNTTIIENVTIPLFKYLHYEDSLETYDKNYTSYYNMFAVCSDFCMCAYVYFIPRLIAFRCITIGEEKKKPHFWMMTYLMVDILLLAVSHICRCFNNVSSPIYLTSMIFHSLTGFLEHNITFFVFFICIQQLAAIESFQYSHLFLEGVFQHLYVFIVVVANGVSNFWRISELYSDNGFDFMEKRLMYVQQIIVPLVVFVTYNLIRMRMRRERYYEQASGADDGKPSITDRMGKIAWYQGITALGSIVALLYSWQMSSSDSNESFVTYILYAQTPSVSCIAFLSILRKNRPTRPCFLLCCTEEDMSRSMPSTRVGISG